MASNTVKVTLLADAKGFQRGMKEAGQATTGFEKTAGVATKAIQGFFALQAVQAVGKFVDESVKAFSELEQSTGSVESVFGDAADTIIDKSKEAADQFGLSAAEFNQQSALLGSQLKTNLGLSADEAAVKVQELIGRASDMAATFGGSTSDAISAIGALLRGETEQIEKYGGSMNQAAIEAHALEMGLIGANDEMTPQIKSAAALDLLYEQTADSAGQFADESETLAGKTQRATAQMENQKALLGQSLSPLYLTWLDTLQKITPLIGSLATGLAEVTGAITATDSALREWEQSAGKAVETADEWLEALANDVNQGLFREWLGGVSTMTDEFTNKIMDGLAEWSLGSEALEDLSGEMQVLYSNGQISKEQFDLFNETIKVTAARTKVAEDHAGEFAARQAALEGAAEGAAGAIGDENAEIQTQIDLLKAQADPVFAAMNAVNDLKDAQANLAETQADTNATAEDLAEAELEVAEALLDAQGAMDALSPEALNAAIDSIATVLGKSKDEVIDLLEQLGILDGTTVTTYIDTVHRQRGTPYRPPGGGPQEFAEGGVVQGPRGAAVPIIAHAGETVLPTHRSSTAARNGGPAMTVNITINAGMGSDPNAISRAVVEALQRYSRANGHIPGVRLAG